MLQMVKEQQCLRHAMQTLLVNIATTLQKKTWKTTIFLEKSLGYPFLDHTKYFGKKCQIALHNSASHPDIFSRQPLTQSRTLTPSTSIARDTMSPTTTTPFHYSKGTILQTTPPIPPYFRTSKNIPPPKNASTLTN